MSSRRGRTDRDWTAQTVLDLFGIAFKDTFAQRSELERQIQSVKAALFDRDYLQAFNKQENLDAYVVRWSPSRALGYSSLMKSLAPVTQLFQRKHQQGGTVQALCIGGGAGAEIVAMGSIALLERPPVKVNVTAIDIAAWDMVVDKIVKFIAGSWYGKDRTLEEAIEAMSLNGSPFSVNFINHDILTLPQDKLQLGQLDLITSMFTTNELFAEQKAGTVKFLQSLSACKSGTLLLIVESAGSYSEIQVGNKTFPVQFLIHHTLTMDNTWQLVDSDDSRWYRLPENLHYELKLENMRFFFRLYSRT